MSWRTKIKARAPSNRPPIIHLEAGENIIKIIDEADEPISTRYGLRLPLIVKPLSSDKTFTWLIPWRDEVGPNSLLWQLKEIADKHGGLKGLTLKVEASSKGGRKSYKVTEFGGQ
ncbi:MAG: hypothetical protein QXF74_04620 [Nitrososphaerota archaeon]